MRILNLKLTNFKKIASDKTIEFNPDVNVLVGKNNAGKTSILQALALAFNLPMQDFNQNDSVYYLVKDGICEIEVNFLFNKRDWEICFAQIKHNYPQTDLSEYPKKLINLKLKQKFTLNIVNKQIKAQNRQCGLPKSMAESNLDINIIQNAINQIVNQNFYNFFGSPLFLDSKRSIVSTEEFRSMQKIRQENNPRRIREKLYLIQKEDKKKFESIKKHVLKVFPEIEDFSIIHDEEKGQFSLQIKERFKKNGDFEDVNYDIHNTGLGMQSLILIIANIFVQDTSVILLDEPEIHMHPSLVEKFINIIEQISSSKQIILTTHSVPLINIVLAEKIFSLKYIPEEKGVIVNSIKKEKEKIDILTDIGFDIKNEIFSSGIITKIVFVEGPSDKKFLTLFAEKFRDELKIKDNFNFPVFEEMGGKGDSFKIAKTIEKLKASKEKGITFMITVDKDEDEKKNDWLKNNLEESELHIWSKRQIENYLLDVKAIAKIANIPEKETKKQIEEQIESQKQNILNRFIKQLFIDWRLPDLNELRNFLNKNKSKNIEEYEGELEKLVFGQFTDKKNEVKKGIKNIEKNFEQKWKKGKWDLCDARKVLKNFKTKYSFSEEDIIEEMKKCPRDIINFWNKII